MTTLETIIATNIDRQLAPGVHEMAAHLQSHHGPGIAAIIAYGSTLRDQSLADSLIDFYLLTDDFATISANPLSRLGCRLVPPNVYYGEIAGSEYTLRCKYAALPIEQFAKKMKISVKNPYFWARFAQPSALVYARDEKARQTVIKAMATATTTLLSHARRLSPAPDIDPTDLWITGLKATYASELRAESPDRARQIIGFNPDYYRDCAQLVTTTAPPANWPLRQFTGKLWSLARLLKAAFTFQGGADYIVWKISRHSGEKIILSDWQRRHPILAAFTLLPRLLRKGAIK